jgi:hypothetical protein
MNRRSFLRGILGTAALATYGWRAAKLEPKASPVPMEAWLEFTPPDQIGLAYAAEPGTGARSNWYEAKFYLTDDELAEAERFIAGCIDLRPLPCGAIRGSGA